MSERPYTQIQENRVGDEYYKRPVIHTGTKIDERVHYLGLAKDEDAIVVDFDKYKDREEIEYSLEDVFEEALERCREEHGDPEEVDGYKIAEKVYNVVNENMEYDKDYVEGVIENYPNRKVDLQSFFLDEGKGVCRHMALSVACVLERMHEDGLVEGTGIINENTVDDNGHMWAEYVEVGKSRGEGQRFIIDPAQNYTGGPGHREERGWDYQPKLGPEDLNPEALNES